MFFGVGEREGGAPGSAEDLPGSIPRCRRSCLHVRDEVPGRVPLQGGVRGCCAAAALIEQHDAIGTRVVHLPEEGRYAAAGAAMQHHRGLSFRVAAFLEIDLMQSGDLEPAAVEWLQFGIEYAPLSHGPVVT